MALFGERYRVGAEAQVQKAYWRQRILYAGRRERTKGERHVKRDEYENGFLHKHLERSEEVSSGDILQRDFLLFVEGVKRPVLCLVAETTRAAGKQGRSMGLGVGQEGDGAKEECHDAGDPLCPAMEVSSLSIVLWNDLPTPAECAVDNERADLEDVLVRLQIESCI